MKRLKRMRALRVFGALGTALALVAIGSHLVVEAREQGQDRVPAEESPALRLSPEPVGQVVGFYATQGSVVRATPIAPEGKGYRHLFRSRRHFYGSQGLVELIELASAELLHRFPEGERLQVGDLSAERGGKIPGHSSHQNGLDADLSYFRVNHQDEIDDPSQGFQELFVVDGKLSANFDLERNWEFLKILVSSGRINRVFLDGVIKTALCDYALRSDPSALAVETLRRLRPYPLHEDHMHLRLTCPSESPNCQEQELPPPGSGCSMESVLTR